MSSRPFSWHMRSSRFRRPGGLTVGARAPCCHASCCGGRASRRRPRPRSTTPYCSLSAFCSAWGRPARGLRRANVFTLDPGRRARHRPGDLFRRRAPGRRADAGAGAVAAAVPLLASDLCHVRSGRLRLGSGLACLVPQRSVRSTLQSMRRSSQHDRRGASCRIGHAAGWAYWRRLAVSRNMLALCIMYIPNCMIFYFCITWLPTYLRQRHGFEATSSACSPDCRSSSACLAICWVGS